MAQGEVVAPTEAQASMSSGDSDINANTVELVTLKQMAKLSGVPENTLAKRGNKPQYEVMGKGTKPHQYSYSEFRNFIASRFPRALPMPSNFLEAQELLSDMRRAEVSD